MERIAVDPQVHVGKPCGAGTRISVQRVLELLAVGVSAEAIARDYYPAFRSKTCVRVWSRRSRWSLPRTCS
ncbi:DUF433 domain-containing protein [Rubidibacter lacunae]|uniref:DUF433 domain-containing protein n=1 Tax=Rubidibacter lacunae TaxID=582514 RepID=UPI00040BEBAA|nr:DUF433 domain-containing protein [Rubidibacter lacunae]